MSQFMPIVLLLLGALLLAYAFSTPGDQLIAASVGGQLIGLSFVVGFYEYMLRRK